MKRFFTLTVVFLALISLGSVAKITFAGPEPLPSGKEMKEVAPAPPPPCTWTGFYVGFHSGYTFGDLTWKDVDFGDNETLIHHDTDSYLAGGQIGYNLQICSWLVLGAEGEFSWFDGSGHRSTSNLSGEEEETTIYDTESNFIGTIGGRVGIPLWHNRLLPYVKGGVAFEQWDYHSRAHQTGIDSGVTQFENDFRTEETRIAPLVGFGLEYALSCHWSIKAEYKHLFTGTETITGRAQDPPGLDNESFDVEMNQDSVVAGLNFKF